MGNHHVRFRGRGRGQSRWEPSPLPDGAEGFEEISIRHSKFAASRFAHQAAPALARFADSSPGPFVAGIRAAHEAIVARKDEDRAAFRLSRLRATSAVGDWPNRQPSHGTLQKPPAARTAGDAAATLVATSPARPQMPLTPRSTPPLAEHPHLSGGFAPPVRPLLHTPRQCARSEASYRHTRGVWASADKQPSAKHPNSRAPSPLLTMVARSPSLRSNARRTPQLHPRAQSVFLLDRGPRSNGG